MTNILRCPVTGQPLHRQNDRYVADGARSYPIVDDIAMLFPDTSKSSTSSNIIEFYNTFGWAEDSNGTCKETQSLTAGFRTHAEYTARCISRLSKYFARGGDYIVDIGSGAISHDELVSYGDNFKTRVCVDLSIMALRQAKRKLGNRGLYVHGDATNLPLRSESADAITCNHLIYQLPATLQRQAILELWRVLKPGGVAVIVYRWLHSGVSVKLETLAKKLKINPVQNLHGTETAAVPIRDEDEPQTRQWFEAQTWPFTYSYDCFRLVDVKFMQKFVPDDRRGQLFLKSLLMIQRGLPTHSARYGQFPAIVIRKPASDSKSSDPVDTPVSKEIIR